MAKTETPKTLERTYNIPLRREYLKAPNWKRTKKAVVAAREFLQRHMKSQDVRLGKAMNEKLWEHGIKNPPHHVKVTAVRDEKGVVKAELFGVKVEEKVPEKKKEARKVKEENKETKKEGAMESTKPKEAQA